VRGSAFRDKAPYLQLSDTYIRTSHVVVRMIVHRTATVADALMRRLSEERRTGVRKSGGRACSSFRQSSKQVLLCGGVFCCCVECFVLLTAHALICERKQALSCIRSRTRCRKPCCFALAPARDTSVAVQL
jgi:hypothetical protein